jgi:hypothetical protein
MKKTTYSDKLKNPRWQKRRLEILNRDGFKCTCCGDIGSTLHIHHSKYTGEPWDAPESDLRTLCEDCHSFVDVDKLTAIQVFKRKSEYVITYVFVLSDKRGVVIYSKPLNDEYFLEIPFDFDDIQFMYDSIKEKL